MKKVIIFLSALIVVFASCTTSTQRVVNYPTDQPVYAAGKDSTIHDSAMTFMLKQWYGKNSCGKDVSGQHWMPIGYTPKDHTVKVQGPQVDKNTLCQSTTITEDASNGFDWWWLWILIPLILACIIGYLIWKHNDDKKWKNKNPGAGGMVSNRNQQKQPEEPKKPSPSVEEINAMAALATIIKDGGGGHAKKGEMDITINGIQPPLFEIHNSGTNSKSGDVTIIMADKMDTKEEGSK